MLHYKEQIKIAREATKSEPNGKLGFNPFVKSILQSDGTFRSGSLNNLEPKE